MAAERPAPGLSEFSGRNLVKLIKNTSCVQKASKNKINTKFNNSSHFCIYHNAGKIVKLWLKYKINKNGIMVKSETNISSHREKILQAFTSCNLGNENKCLVPLSI